MAGEECRGLCAASAFIGRTASSAAIRRMVQRRATTVQHPLASAASLTPPQLPLGEKTPRNDEELPLGDETPGNERRASPAGERGNIDASPASLGGRNPKEHKTLTSAARGRPSFPWGTKPQGTQNLRATDKTPGTTTVETTKKRFSWGTKP